MSPTDRETMDGSDQASRLHQAAVKMIGRVARTGITTARLGRMTPSRRPARTIRSYSAFVRGLTRTARTDGVTGVATATF